MMLGIMHYYLIVTRLLKVLMCYKLANPPRALKVRVHLGPQRPQATTGIIGGLRVQAGRSPGSLNRRQQYYSDTENPYLWWQIHRYMMHEVEQMLLARLSSLAYQYIQGDT